MNLLHILKKIMDELFFIQNDKYSKHIYNEIYKLSKQLLNFKNTLVVIKKIQTYYINTLQKYKNNEIKKCTNDSEYFSSLINTYKYHCEEFFIYPQINKHLEKNYDIQYFYNLLKQLEELITTVNLYILNKRKEFFSFYLLNDENFLNIYLNIKDIKTLNKYIQHIIPSIKKLIYQNEIICGVLSKDNQRIIFKEQIKYKKLEFLLNQINLEIKNWVLKNIQNVLQNEIIQKKDINYINNDDNNKNNKDNKKFESSLSFYPLKEDTYLIFLKITNMQILFIILNIYFTYIMDIFIKKCTKK